MIQYRHYSSGFYNPETRYGIALYKHTTRWTLDVYFGSHVFVWFRDKI